MEKALITQNRHWDNERYANLLSRTVADSVIRKLKLREMQVLLGIRRSGKSTIFKLLINHLCETVPPQSILYANLDDPYYSEVWNDAKGLYRVVETAEKLTQEKVCYLFLDEVQNVRGWEKYVKSAYDSEVFKKIFITGSNSSLLQGGYARLLSGRFVADYVYPLSFGEILKNRNIKPGRDLIKNKPHALRLIDDMLLYGSFPEVFKTPDIDLKREILFNYYETIILKDCVANNNIRDIKTFRELSFYLISNISALYSYNSLARAVQSNENTVREFLRILEDSFLLGEVKNFSYSLKAQSRAKKKVYCVDNSFLNMISFRFSDNKGKLLENLVYTELVKNGLADLFFHLDTRECDFVIKRGKELIPAQVTYEIGESNLDREVDGLAAAMKKFNQPEGYLITYDREGPLTGGITMVPVWKMAEGLFGPLQAIS